MKRARMIAIAAAAAAGIVAFAGPASAAYVRLGHVEVGHRIDRDRTWTQFGGPMEGLRVVANRSDIFCRSIRVQYGNGNWDRVFSGALREGHPIYVDLAGHSRKVRQIQFVCRSRERHGRIYISADVGRYRDEWRHSPGWARTWSHIFNWGAVPPRAAAAGWIVLGRERFEGRRDHERRFAGWRGRHVDRIALRPIRKDARCNRVRVTFQNGSHHNLAFQHRGILRAGGFYRYDLPGRMRNIRRLDLVCHAVGRYAVTIEIMARK